MITIHNIAELRAHVAARRDAGDRIGFVPTMGALHEGHLALCDIASQHADHIVMSIFVNPLQFRPGEDLAKYPRNLERDAEMAQSRGVDVVFAPNGAEMYPDGASLVRAYAPALGNLLCGRFRPGHFEGVLTVVGKLFNIVEPDVAVFGQKDLQQAMLIRRMVRDLDFDIEIVVAPIVREPDGLAMSSRNAYLSPAERQAATALYRALMAAQAAFDAGERDPSRITAAAATILHGEPGVSVQYIELVEPDTLETPGHAAPGHAVAIAAHVGKTRLIDNHLLQ